MVRGVLGALLVGAGIAALGVRGLALCIFGGLAVISASLQDSAWAGGFDARGPLGLLALDGPCDGEALPRVLHAALDLFSGQGSLGHSDALTGYLFVSPDCWSQGAHVSGGVGVDLAAGVVQGFDLSGPSGVRAVCVSAAMVGVVWFDAYIPEQGLEILRLRLAARGDLGVAQRVLLAGSSGSASFGPSLAALGARAFLGIPGPVLSSGVLGIV